MDLEVSYPLYVKMLHVRSYYIKGILISRTKENNQFTFVLLLVISLILLYKTILFYEKMAYNK